MRIVAGILCATLLSLASGSVSALGTYRFTDLGTLGGTYSYPFGINDAGQVTGASTTAGDAVTHAFLWNGTTMVDLGTLGGTYSGGNAINGAGQVTGASTTAGDAVTHAFLWNGTTMVDLGSLCGTCVPGTNSYGTAINSAGQVAGNSEFVTRDVGAFGHAFLWSGATMVDLDMRPLLSSYAVAINEAGQVTGQLYGAYPNDHAFLWNGTTMVDLDTLGGFGSGGGAINAAGEVTGFADTNGYAEPHAFLWNGTTMVDLGTLGGTSGSGSAINSAGQVTGSSSTAGDATAHAFLWNGTTMVDLGTLGGTYSGGNAINDAGQVVGFSYITGDADVHAFVSNGTMVEDLNDLIEPSDPSKPFVTLNSALGINSVGQIMALGSDSRTSEFHAYIVSPGAADSTPPMIQSSVTGTLGKGGWYVSSVQVAWTVTDAESAISTSTGCGPSAVTVDTAGTTFTCSATSAGGTSTKSVTIKRDATAPSAWASARPSANRYGWRDENVTGRFSGSDTMSRGVTCDPQVVLTAEGAGQSTSGRCYDAAGNQSVLVSATGINIDKSNPKITITTPSNGAVFKRNQVVVAAYSCTDGLSGIVSCEGTVPNGHRIKTAESDKNVKFTVTATDKAGNTTKVTLSYAVK